MTVPFLGREVGCFRPTPLCNPGGRCLVIFMPFLDPFSSQAIIEKKRGWF